MRKIVHGINNPLSLSGNESRLDTVDKGIAHDNVRRGHVNFSAQQVAPSGNSPARIR